MPRRKEQGKRAQPLVSELRKLLKKAERDEKVAHQRVQGLRTTLKNMLSRSRTSK